MGFVLNLDFSATDRPAITEKVWSHNVMRVPIVHAIVLPATFAVGLVFNALASAQNAPKVHLRFLNDSAELVNFYIDGQFTCAIKPNREENEAFCDAYDASVGKHTISIKGARLVNQSCDVYVTDEGEYAILSKGKRLHCFTYAQAD